MPAYRFPNGDVLTSGIAIFERILVTRETAVAVDGSKGAHEGRVYTFSEVSHLARRPEERKAMGGS